MLCPHAIPGPGMYARMRIEQPAEQYSIPDSCHDNNLNIYTIINYHCLAATLLRTCKQRNHHMPLPSNAACEQATRQAQQHLAATLLV